MDSTARRTGGRGFMEGFYRVFMRRNSVYFTFIIAGAFVGERVVDYGVHKLWEHNNLGMTALYGSMCIPFFAIEIAMESAMGSLAFKAPEEN